MLLKHSGAPFNLCNDPCFSRLVSSSFRRFIRESTSNWQAPAKRYLVTHKYICIFVLSMFAFMQLFVTACLLDELIYGYDIISLYSHKVQRRASGELPSTAMNFLYSLRTFTYGFMGSSCISPGFAVCPPVVCLDSTGLKVLWFSSRHSSFGTSVASHLTV